MQRIFDRTFAVLVLRLMVITAAVVITISTCKFLGRMLPELYESTLDTLNNWPYSATTVTTSTETTSTTPEMTTPAMTTPEMTTSEMLAPESTTQATVNTSYDLPPSEASAPITTEEPVKPIRHPLTFPVKKANSKAVTIQTSSTTTSTNSTKPKKISTTQANSDVLPTDAPLKPLVPETSNTKPEEGNSLKPIQQPLTTETTHSPVNTTEEPSNVTSP
jgi:hypothetical protein